MNATTIDLQMEAARLAAQMIPAYSRVLGIGPESAAVEAVLPAGCSYTSTDILPDETIADIIVILGTDAISNHQALALAISRLSRPLVCVSPIAGLSESDLIPLRLSMGRVGFRLQCGEAVTPALSVLKWVSDDGIAQPVERGTKRVLVMSHYNTSNFGDRLGYHVLNSLLPAEAEVTYGTHHPWSVPDRDYDLLILGIGTSLLPQDARDPEFHKLLDKIPRAIGIFGTQYRELFHEPTTARAFDAILGKLTTWWARYEEDILAFGRGRSNVRHLGDWLVSAFPVAVPTLEKGLTIPPDIAGQEMPLDRMIQRIQSYRGVSSGRLHTLLCALPSADDVAYQEQRVTPDLESGKFRSMLYDIFGRTFEENKLFSVDHEAVVRYKRKVEANLVELRAEMYGLLGCQVQGS
jgi:hypothetical protein